MLEARGITLSLRGTTVLSGVSLHVDVGEIVGLAGPSGAGKTTLGRILAGLARADSGHLRHSGKVQYLHQAPLIAFNPRWRMGRSIAEGGAIDAGLANHFGVDDAWFDRYPHELSGGQLQRISILRGLLAKPHFLIADEITASLDAVSQAEIWYMLRKLATQRNIGILAISHDSALLCRIASRVINL